MWLFQIFNASQAPLFFHLQPQPHRHPPRRRYQPPPHHHHLRRLLLVAKKLHQITKSSTTTSSLFQAIGEAAGTSGYVNITDIKGGKVGFSPVDSDSDGPIAKFVKSLRNSDDPMATHSWRPKPPLPPPPTSMSPLSANPPYFFLT